MNMSYCRFENTSNDLRDCVRAMDEVDELEDLDLSQSELRSMKYMVRLAEEFLENANRLLHNEQMEDAE
jgi:hypothetical protein